MLIINADVRTMAGRDFPQGFVELRGEKIGAVGPMEACPPLEGQEVLDAQGGVAMPGFVDAHSHIGMWEDGLGFEGDDGNEDTDPCTPHLRGLDGVNPMDRAFAEARAAGVCTVVTGPGSANPVAGQMCALKTLGRRVDDMVVREPLAIKLAMGENPKTSYHEKQQGPATRMAIAAVVREQLAKARRYQEQLDRAAQDEELEEPEFDAKCEALLPLLRGEIPAHIHAHRADDLFTGLRIAREFGFRPVVIHGTEGYLVADLLAQEQVPVVVGPLIGARTKPELARSDIRAAGILAAAGVPVAICTDHPEVPENYLLLSAQMAAQAGMDRQAALEAITIQAARICGLQDRVGSLEPGKDGDLVLFAQDPLDSREPPKAVFLLGQRVV